MFIEKSGKIIFTVAKMFGYYIKRNIISEIIVYITYYFYYQ